MNLVDLIILILVALTAVRGFTIGLYRQVLSLGGFILGIFIAAWLVAKLTPHIPGGALQPLVITLLILVMAVVLGSLVELMGVKLSDRIHRRHLADEVNRWLGTSFSVVAALFCVWLVGIMFSHSPILALSQPVQRSEIIRSLDRILPPTPGALADIERLFATHGFPEVFAGLEPNPASTVAPPPPASVRAAADADAASVVQIEGTACGELVAGSGFIVEAGLVATDAHVVAGIDHPTVTDSAGDHQGSVVYFDPNLDLALLRVGGLHGQPLTILTPSQPLGTLGAVLGYPGGGPYVAKSSAVLAQLTAVGRNIYGQTLVARSIYEIQADVEPGNSGGPLTLANGQVVGMVFARSTTSPGIGYALTGSEVEQRVTLNGNDASPVSTGACIE